jgi:hypothetical protein
MRSGHWRRPQQQSADTSAANKHYSLITKGAFDGKLSALQNYSATPDSSAAERILRADAAAGLAAMAPSTNPHSSFSFNVQGWTGNISQAVASAMRADGVPEGTATRMAVWLQQAVSRVS